MRNVYGDLLERGGMIAAGARKGSNMELAIKRPEDGALLLDDFRRVGPERRREQRTTLFKPIWVFVPMHEPQIGHVVDCSPHGVGLLLRTRLSEGDEFGLKLRLPLLRLVTYSVRYCRPMNGQFRIGALLSGIGGMRGHPDLEFVFRALMETASVTKHAASPN
jgi:hypothetical protein